MFTETIKMTLSAETVDLAAEKTMEICAQAKVTKSDRLPVRLAVEESLLNLREKFGDGQAIELITRKLPGQTLLIVRCRSGEPFDPFRRDDSAEAEASARVSSILGYLHFMPRCQYKDGCNDIIFRLKKADRSPLLKLGIVIASALLIGVLGRLLLPGDVISALSSGFLAPTYDKFLDLLGCVSGPLVFCSMVWAIYGMGDVATLNRLGRGVIGRMLADVAVVTVLCCGLFPLFGCTMSGSGVSFEHFSDIYAMLLDMIPGDIVSPFQDGNTLQLILLSALIGFCLLCLGGGTGSVAKGIGQLNSMLSFVMDLIGRIIPFFIAIVLINLIWSDDMAVMLQAWKFLVILVICLLADMLVFTLLTAARLRTSPLRLARSVMPAWLVALTTASSAASFGTLVEDCEDRLGISPVLTEFGVPVGTIMQKTATAINNALAVFYISGVYGIPLSPTRLVMMVLAVIATSIATPPVVGGGTIAYAALFAQMGLPTEAVTVMLTMDMVTDFFMTSTDMYTLQLTLARASKSAGGL